MLGYMGAVDPNSGTRNAGVCPRSRRAAQVRLEAQATIILPAGRREEGLVVPPSGESSTC